MKKVIFSAIALLAFTATSFAAEVKKEEKKAEAKNEVKAEAKKDVIVVSELCDSVYDSWTGGGTCTGTLPLSHAYIAAKMKKLCEDTLATGNPIVICG